MSKNPYTSRGARAAHIGLLASGVMTGTMFGVSLLAAVPFALLSATIAVKLMFSYDKLYAAKKIMDQIMAQSSRDEDGNVRIDVLISIGDAASARKIDVEEEHEADVLDFKASNGSVN